MFYIHPVCSTALNNYLHLLHLLPVIKAFHRALLQRIRDQATNHERPQKGHVLNEFHLVNVNLLFSWQAPRQSHGTFRTSYPSPARHPESYDWTPQLPTTTTTSCRWRCFGRVDSQASGAKNKSSSYACCVQIDVLSCMLHCGPRGMLRNSTVHQVNKMSLDVRHTGGECIN